jgi:hypothetical protein
MRLHVTRSLAAIAAIAIVSGCAARAADSDIPTMRQAHMQMTLHQPQRPGDRARANAIVAAARKVMAEYPTVQAAEDAGFTKFLPRIPLPIEHYTKREYAIEAARGRFDPMHPTSLIFQRSGETLTLVGVMYTAPNRADRSELDRDVPLSFGTWHRHVDFCAPLNGARSSIDTADACAKAGGIFIPIVFGWMVHVWPNEKTGAAIWAVDRNANMERTSM